MQEPRMGGFTTTETARILGYSAPAAIRVLLKKKQLYGVKYGRDWVIPHDEVDRLKSERKRAGIIK